jgi:hypothetical protein
MKNNDKTYGRFSVYTENDEEGRTRKLLGHYEGSIHKIALHLAHKCYYTLSFEPLKIINDTDCLPSNFMVHVSFSNICNTAIEFKDMYKDNTDLEILDSSYFKSVVIVDKSKQTNNIVLDQKRREALSKLTDEERELLGLK